MQGRGPRGTHGTKVKIRPLPAKRPRPSTPPDQLMSANKMAARQNAAGDLVISIAPTEPMENVMVWVDGALIVTQHGYMSNPPFGGHGWERIGNVYTITVRRAISPLEPGPADVVVSTWRMPDLLGRYYQTTARIAGDPSRPVMPTVLGGQVIGPRVVRTLFHCDPRTVRDDDLAAELHAAGVTHLSVGIFNSPGDAPWLDTPERWLAEWNNLVRQWIDWAVANGFRIIGIGDDIFRTRNERNWTHTGSFREFAFRHVAAYLRDTGVCDGVEMVDEVGDDPDGAIPGVWESLEDYEPGEFLSWWRAENGPPIAWPNQRPLQWEVPELSDYSSRYSTRLEWRDGRAPPYAGTVWQILNCVRRGAADVPSSRPWIYTAGAMGPYYQKRVEGNSYQPGDKLLAGGMRASDTIAQVWMALAYGASGIRLYGYDFALWRNQRASAIVGVDMPDGLQTGSRPGDERWPGIVAALAAIGAREAALVGGPAYVPTVSGPWVSGRRGGLWWAVNASERTHDAGAAGQVITPAGESVSSVVPAGCAILWVI